MPAAARMLMESRIAFLLGALLVCGPRPAAAQHRFDLELSPFAGGTFFLHDGPSALVLEGSAEVPAIVEGARFEDTWGAGATAGLRLTEYLAVETLVSWTPTWLMGTNFRDGTDVYAYMYGLNGVLHLPLPGPLHPYAGVGVGGTTYDYSGSIRSHTHWMTTFVGGLSYELGEGRSLRIQARDYLTAFDSRLPTVGAGWQNDLMITAGMSWRVPLGRRSIPRLPSWPDFDPRLPRK
jgi:hypothetical protein